VAELKLTKTELRNQQNRLIQLSRYLPTLQLKKALLQTEVSHARQALHKVQEDVKKRDEKITAYASLFTKEVLILMQKSIVQTVFEKSFENIAGAEIPKIDKLEYKLTPYDLFDTPAWFEEAAVDVMEMKKLKIAEGIAKARLSILEKELREVSIRVNLFEKVLIPRAQANIKKIKIFLGDLQLAAVSQAKVAKAKIMSRKALHETEVAV